MNRIALRRRGVAPLELVLAMPFLAAVLALTLSVGVASMARSTACVQARHGVWAQRPDANAGARPDRLSTEVESAPFSVFAAMSPLGGAVSGEVEQSVRVYGPLGSVTAVAGATVVTGTWDHRSSTGSEFRGDGPHLSVLRPMLPGVATGTFANLLNPRPSASNTDHDSRVDAIDRESDATRRAAEAEQAKAKEAYDREMAALEAEHDAAQTEYNKLEAELRPLRERLAGVDREIAELSAVAAPSAEESRRLSDLREERGELSPRVKDLGSKMATEQSKMADVRRKQRLMKEQYDKGK